MTEEIEALRARVRELEARLEIHPSGYDGVASRDETIRQQERVIEGLRAELDGYRANAEQLERWVEERDAEIERKQQRERALRAALERIRDEARDLTTAEAMARAALAAKEAGA